MVGLIKVDEGTLAQMTAFSSSTLFTKIGVTQMIPLLFTPLINTSFTWNIQSDDLSDSDELQTDSEIPGRPLPSATIHQWLVITLQATFLISVVEGKKVSVTRPEHGCHATKDSQR